MAGAAKILVSLHGRLLREVCGADQRHHEGFGSAGGALFRARLIAAKMKKKLVLFETVAAFIRHSTVQLADQTVQDLTNMIKQRSHVNHGEELKYQGTACFFIGEAADGSE